VSLIFTFKGVRMSKRGLLLALCIAQVAVSAGAAPRVLRVLTHSSFAATPSVIAAFEAANGVKVQFSAGGDGGETLTKAILSKNSPLADVLYGVDNTFLGRALAADILTPYASPALASIPAALQVDATHRMLPVDFGYIALNYDRKFFAEKALAVPQTLEDLAAAPARGLLVVENPATSTPGLAFLLATIAHFGGTGSSTWQSYWSALRKNDVLVVNGWEEAYYNEFSAQGKGRRPIVVSYATSPAYELNSAADPKPAVPPTGNILPEGASFRQIEFVGILKGAREPELARKFVDFMLSETFQADIPLQMWVYPSNARAPVPDLFRKFAPVPAMPAAIEPAVIETNRDSWIKAWTQIVLK
jgi:thiamine transport system substrate-binding protein